MAPLDVAVDVSLCNESNSLLFIHLGSTDHRFVPRCRVLEFPGVYTQDGAAVATRRCCCSYMKRGDGSLKKKNIYFTEAAYQDFTTDVSLA